MSKTPRRSPASRPQLLTGLDEAIRKLSAQSVLISDLVATRVGLNSTDLECLDLLYLAGATTAGRLSAHTGLTTGATTAAIDRLERAGFVARRRDPNDRRVVLVEVLGHCGPHIEPFYRPLQELLTKVNRRYDNGELTTVVRYLTEALEAGASHVAWLQTQPALSHQRCRQHLGVADSFGASAAGRAAAPRATVVRARTVRRTRPVSHKEPSAVSARRK
jgi:DNA-binding MarR family transcriptional regulator